MFSVSCQFAELLTYSQLKSNSNSIYFSENGFLVHGFAVYVQLVVHVFTVEKYKQQHEWYQVDIHDIHDSINWPQTLGWKLWQIS